MSCSYGCNIIKPIYLCMSAFALIHYFVSTLKLVTHKKRLSKRITLINCTLLVKITVTISLVCEIVKIFFWFWSFKIKNHACHSVNENVKHFASVQTRFFVVKDKRKKLPSQIALKIHSNLVFYLN